MARKTNYYELTEQEQQTYRFAVVSIILNNDMQSRIMHPTQVNSVALEMVHAVNLTIGLNPIIELQKEMD